MSDIQKPTSASPSTADKVYAERLERLQTKWWKRLLNVQLPWQRHLRSMKLGRTLDVGCGRGRNLTHLPTGSVGVDHNPDSIAQARADGCEAYTVDEFFDNPEIARAGRFDSLLAAHLIEHLTADEARAILGSYLPFVQPGGRIVFVTPQERGYASDMTHVAFTDFDQLRKLCTDLGLEVESQHSFPFPRRFGKIFIYNEFYVLARTPLV